MICRQCKVDHVRIVLSHKTVLLGDVLIVLRETCKDSVCSFRTVHDL